ncbi:cleavage and polyadenylation specificity factor-like protein [Trypanosoma brucei equiperdum]|uniref:Cleavage and polyadenylation specificity factor-like protein n=1 Tax=Trypanosoma brucei equiperdum TaxID=630700 RepID=A0A3L6KUT1_9TRYP|nr:cleavage and polyadenylation specificity factor-like protein [Trypanosoma brucei equiperdum]
MLHATVAPSLPASAVTHSVSGRFSEGLPDNVRELFIFKKNHVELWRVPQDLPSGEKRLLYVTGIQLNAPPACVAVCRPTGFSVDVLVMCFDDFHVSFVQYDLLSMRLRTVLLVQLDDREVSRDMTPLEPIMRADPTGRFVIVLARRRHLFLLPLLGPMTSEGALISEAQQPDNAEEPNIPGATPSALGVADDWGDEGDYDEETKENKVAESSDAACGGASPEENSSKVVGSSSVLLRIGAISMFTLSKVLKSSIRYVRDVQFIGTLGEPLLAILCERKPTWAGRVKLVEWRTKAVESNMLSQQVTWVQISGTASALPKLLLVGEVDGVPYNVTHMLPVGSISQAMSGVICFGVNTIMHITTRRGYGAYWNETGKEECTSSKSSAVSYGKINWCDKKLESSTALFRVNLSLANCVAATLEGKDDEGSLQAVAVSEDDGVVLMLQFLSQGSNIHDIRIAVLTSGCYCSSITPISERLMFLGSAVSDSCIATVRPQGSSMESRFQVVESMEAIGSIRDVDVVDCSALPDGGSNTTPRSEAGGSWLEETPFAELAGMTSLDPMPNLSPMDCRAVMDLAVCAGQGSSGCIYVLRQSIRNAVVRREKVNAVSAFFLELPRNPKRLRTEGDDREGAAQNVAGPPSRLLLTGLSFTIPFTVRGESVQQERHSEFIANCRTVFAAGVPWLGALLQLTEKEGRIISSNGRKLLHRFSFSGERDLDENRQVKSACLAPELQALFVLLDGGVLLQFTLSEMGGAPQRKEFAAGVVAFTLWREPKSIIMFMSSLTMMIQDAETGSIQWIIPQMGTLPPYTVSEEPVAEATKEPSASDDLPHVTHVEVLNLLEESATDPGGIVATALLVVLSTGELAVYHVVGPDKFGPLRLIKKFHHFLDTKAVREVIESIEAKKMRLQSERTMIEYDTQSVRHCSRRIIPFAAVAGQSGAYVCGQHPLFLMWDNRTRQLVAYRHQAPGPVRGFVPFTSMPGGFIYCCEGFVDFAVMNTYCSPGGNGWLRRRIHIGATPHFIVYDPPGRSCFVVTSKKVPFRPQRASFDVQLKIQYDEDSNTVQSVTTEAPVCNMPAIKPGTGVRVPLTERFEVRLHSTFKKGWDCTDKLMLDENEKVLGAQMVEIHQDANADGSATAPVCVVCTAFPLGEDVTCRGRIILLASRNIKGRRSIVQLHSEPLNGPATAVAGICSQIAVAVGGTIKIFRYDWETKKLVVSAFLYAGMYATRLSVFRNYIIYGDLCRSCSMARFNEENHTLTVLGRDRSAVSVVHCDMMYHDRAFGILCSDDERNVLIMGYTPRVQETDAGTHPKVLESVLSLDGEYRLPSGSLVKSLRFRSTAGNSSVTLYVSNYGEIGFIVPIGEQANRTALWVTRRLQIDLPCEAGLTPRMFLSLNQRSPRNSLRGKEMLVPAPLLRGLFSLDLRSRKAIARAAYTQLDRVANIVALVHEECGLF